MARVNLRADNEQKLTVAQADDSLKHLSRLTEVTTATQLYTGGMYRSTGTHALTLPTDGNYVAVLVVSGTPSLIGVVDGVTNPVLQPGAMREYIKVSGAWQILSGSGGSGGGLGNFNTYDDDVTVSIDNPLLWMANAADAVITIPSGFAENTTLGIVRAGNGAVTISPSDSEGIRDPSTGVPNLDGVYLNEKNRVLWLKKGATHWSPAT